MSIQNVLIVDDEDVIRLTTSLILKKLRVSATAIDNGPEALSFYMVHKDEIDLVIVDGHMPEMSGIELFQKLKDFDPSVSVVISSGFVDESEQEAFDGIGIVGLLNKPFSVRDIKALFTELDSTFC
jgi:CheY-like chemotaxis protein